MIRSRRPLSIGICPPYAGCVSPESEATKPGSNRRLAYQSPAGRRPGQFTHDVGDFAWQFAREITKRPDAFGKPFTGRRMKEDAPAACRERLRAPRRQAGDDTRQNIS